MRLSYWAWALAMVAGASHAAEACGCGDSTRAKARAKSPNAKASKKVFTAMNGYRLAMANFQKRTAAAASSPASAALQEWAQWAAGLSPGYRKGPSALANKKWQEMRRTLDFSKKKDQLWAYRHYKPKDKPKPDAVGPQGDAEPPANADPRADAAQAARRAIAARGSAGSWVAAQTGMIRGARQGIVSGDLASVLPASLLGGIHAYFCAGKACDECLCQAIRRTVAAQTTDTQALAEM